MTDETTSGSCLPLITPSEGDEAELPKIDLPKTPASSSSSSSSLANKNGKVKIAPHYLRASEGSCHDFCKYGKKHVFELKGRPILKGKTHGKIPPLPTSQRKSPDSLKSKSKHDGEMSTSDDLKRPEISAESRESSSLEETDPNSEKNTSQKIHPTANYKSEGLNLCPSKKLSLSGKPKMLLKVPSRKRASQSGNASRANVGGPPSKKPAVTSKLKKPPLKSEIPFSGLKGVPDLKKPSASPEPRALSKRPSINTRVFHPYLKRPASSMKDKVKKEDGSSSAQNSTADEKKKSKLRPDSASLKRAASPAQGKIGKEVGSLTGNPISGKLNIRSRSALPYLVSSSVRGMVEKEGASSSSGQLMNKKSTVDEKRKSRLQSSNVPVFKVASSLTVKTGKDGSSSNPRMGRKSTAGENKRSNVRPVSSLVKSSHSENLRAAAKQKAFTAVGSRSTKRKVVTRMEPKVSSEVKSHAARRLTFRPGRVISSPQADVDPPRRLKFRQMKRISSSVSEKGKISLRRKEFSQGQFNRHRETLKVVLRHQEIKEKKAGQTLLNDVIELTANKLAETSNSKVKALVGAFETVISLQEGKPTAASG